MVLALIFYLLAAVVLLAMLRLAFRALTRVVLALLLAVIVGIGAGIAADRYSQLDGLVIGVFAALLAIVPATGLIWRWRGPLSNAPAEPSTAALETNLVESGKLTPENAQLKAAWEQAEAVVPSRKASIRRAREACETFLARCGEESRVLDTELLDARVLIVDHVPPLVTETVQACRGADSAEAQLLKGKMIEQLEALGNRARMLLEQERMQVKDGLAVRELHLRNRLEPDSTFEALAQKEAPPAPSGWLRRFRPPRQER